MELRAVSDNQIYRQDAKSAKGTLLLKSKVREFLALFLF